MKQQRREGREKRKLTFPKDKTLHYQVGFMKGSPPGCRFARISETTVVAWWFSDEKTASDIRKWIEELLQLGVEVEELE